MSSRTFKHPARLHASYRATDPVPQAALGSEAPVMTAGSAHFSFLFWQLVSASLDGLHSLCRQQCSTGCHRQTLGSGKGMSGMGLPKQGGEAQPILAHIDAFQLLATQTASMHDGHVRGAQLINETFICCACAPVLSPCGIMCCC